MNPFLKAGKFIFVNPSILYSFFVLVFIPISIYYLTFSTINSLQKNIEDRVQKTMLFSANILSQSVLEDLENENYSNIDSKFKNIKKDNNRISKLRVIVKEDNNFKIVSSLDSHENGNFIKGDPISLAFQNGVSYVYQTSEPTSGANKRGEDITPAKYSIFDLDKLLFSEDFQERFWDIVYPVKKDDKVLAVLSISVSTKDVDEYLINSISRSYILTLFLIIISLFLIIHHTFLLKYPILLKKLKEVDKMKDDFIRMAIHEIQSPITNLRGYVEFLKDNMKGEITEEKKKENEVALDILDKSAKRLTDLVSDLLEVARIEQERISLKMEPLDPSLIVKNIVQELSRKAREYNIELEFIDNGFSKKIIASEGHLKEVIYNLVDNAIKYTSPVVKSGKKGKVTVSVEVDEVHKKYIISVHDNGIGISADEQQRLFEKFYRVRNKETAEIQGTGLGLWIVKNLTEKMGGRIYLESIKGVGTKVTLVFSIENDKLKSSK